MTEPKQKPQPPKLTVAAEISLGQYANFVSIAHNYAEVLLDFGRTLPNRSDIPVVARIIMNPFQAKQLLRALTHNLQIYERNFGPIPEPPQPQGQATSSSPPDDTN